MACSKNTNIEINEEYINSILNTKNRTNCRKYKSVYPSFTPTINSLSVSISVHGTYSNVMINGSNFLNAFAIVTCDTLNFSAIVFFCILNPFK